MYVLFTNLHVEFKYQEEKLWMILINLCKIIGGDLPISMKLAQTTDGWRIAV